MKASFPIFKTSRSTLTSHTFHLDPSRKILYLPYCNFRQLLGGDDCRRIINIFEQMLDSDCLRHSDPSESTREYRKKLSSTQPHNTHTLLTHITLYRSTTTKIRPIFTKCLLTKFRMAPLWCRGSFASE